MDIIETRKKMLRDLDKRLGSTDKDEVKEYALQRFKEDWNRLEHGEILVSPMTPEYLTEHELWMHTDTELKNIHKVKRVFEVRKQSHLENINLNQLKLEL